jgi:hypothetical protein
MVTSQRKADDLLMSIYEKLLKIQTELKAPKNQYNSFGKFNYRSCEDILEGLKPVLQKYKAAVLISDEIVLIRDRYYVKATATLFDAESNDQVSATAYAREAETKTGMDLSQLTGSTSSYARKYALNGLFAIDDTKDSDALPREQKRTKKPQGTITKQQAKKMFELAENDTQLVKEVLETFNYKNSTDVKLNEYDKICNIIVDTLQVKKEGA